MGILLATVLGTRSFVEGEYDVVKSSVYNSLTKPAWGLAICVISFLCIHGYGGNNSLKKYQHSSVISS